jgi:hypothetical protein
VEAALYSREFEAALWAKLLIKPPWKFRDFRVQTDGAGFNVGAHPDISKKLATMMFYLPTGDEVCSARTEGHTNDADFEAWPNRSRRISGRRLFDSQLSHRCTGVVGGCLHRGPHNPVHARRSRRRRRGATARACTRSTSTKPRAPSTAQRSAR